MTNFKLLITSILAGIFILLFNIEVNAQMGIAVSKNENGSSVKYEFDVCKTVKGAQAKAKKILEDGEFKNIFVLRSDENTGHELSTGHYVIILSSRKMLGKFFISYGLGGSEKSIAEATNRAVIHMKEWDYGYKNSQGYSIVKSGKIEDLFPDEEENMR